ncbi:hypothetical protein LCGC14_2003060, partial [marine sediment metagenome]
TFFFIMTSKQNVGNAGEYYISALLSAKDFVVTVTLGRNIGYDLLVENPNGSTLKISVKTALSKKAKDFLLSNKCEKLRDPNLFYAFIRLNEFEEMPDYWIVPAEEVAEVLAYSHKKWLSTPRRNGEKHNDTTMRAFYVVENQYLPKDWIKKVEKFKSNFKILENFKVKI